MYAKGDIVATVNSTAPYANNVGEIVSFIRRIDQPSLLNIRLDRGYQARHCSYPNILYDCVVEESEVRPFDGKTARTYSVQNCSLCGKLCFSHYADLPKIAFNIQGMVVCEDCRDKVYFDQKTERLKIEEERKPKKKRGSSAAKEKPQASAKSG